MARRGGGGCVQTTSTPTPRPLPTRGRGEADAHHRPYSLRSRVGRLPVPRPSKYRGDGAPSGASFGRSHVPFPARGASRRAIRGVFLPAPGRAFGIGSGRAFRLFRRPALHRPTDVPSLLGRPHRPPSASSSQGLLVVPGGASAPPGCGRSVRLPRAGAASAKKDAELLHKCTAASNFLLAVFHKLKVRKLGNEDRAIFFRALPRRARKIWIEHETQ